VKIVKKIPSSILEIETISKIDMDYADLEKARKNRANASDDYISLDEVNW